MEHNETEFTHDELIEALQNAQSLMSDDPAFFTAPQLAELTGISIKEVRRRLKKLIRAGYVRPDRSIITNYLGNPTSAMGVRWIGEKDDR